MIAKTVVAWIAQECGWKKKKNYIYIYIPETEAKRRKNYIYTGKKCIDKLQLPCAEKCIDLIFKSLIITRLKSVLTKIWFQLKVGSIWVEFSIEAER